MNNIIIEILDLPIIVQGALGSFLFWLLHILVKKGFKLINKRIKDDKKEGNELFTMLSDEIDKGKVNNATLTFIVMLYNGLGFIVRFLIVTIIGYILMHFIPVFGYIGYLIGLYYLFKASTYLSLNPDDD